MYRGWGVRRRMIDWGRGSIGFRLGHYMGDSCSRVGDHRYNRSRMGVSKNTTTLVAKRECGLVSIGFCVSICIGLSLETFLIFVGNCHSNQNRKNLN